MTIDLEGVSAWWEAFFVTSIKLEVSTDRIESCFSCRAHVVTWVQYGRHAIQKLACVSDGTLTRHWLERIQFEYYIGIVVTWWWILLYGWLEVLRLLARTNDLDFTYLFEQMSALVLFPEGGYNRVRVNANDIGVIWEER